MMMILNFQAYNLADSGPNFSQDQDDLLTINTGKIG